MRYRIFILAALAALAAHAVQMASQPWVTNRIAEAVAAIPAARADLTPATNYTDEVVSSATNNLRAKADLVYRNDTHNGIEKWTVQIQGVADPLIAEWNEDYQRWHNRDPPINGLGIQIAASGYIFDTTGGEFPFTLSGDSATVSDGWYTYTLTPVRFAEDRLALVSEVPAVPAGVVVTNEYGEVPSLTVASLQSAMPSFGAMYASSADITTFLTVGGTNITDALAANAAAIASTASTIANAGYLATNAYGAVSADLTVDGNLTVGSRGTISAEELNIYTRASIGITDGSLTIGSPEGSGSLVVGTTNVMDALAARALATDISTNNPAFVAAVTNCPVVLTNGGVDYGDFGQYGTIGALLAALAAAVVALRGSKQDKYPFVAATPDNGVITLQDAKVQTWTPSAGASVTVGAAAYVTNAPARDAVLVIDCSSLTDGQEPTVTWGTAFHPRTDAGTDFACAAGARNVYYISEYATGEFVVGGWQETAGGSGT